MAYAPQPGTIPHKVVEHLRTLPAGTKVASRPILDAIGQPGKLALPTFMGAAIRAGLVKAEKSPDTGLLLWSLGDGVPLAVEKEDDAPPAPKATPKPKEMLAPVVQRVKDSAAAPPADPWDGWVEWDGLRYGEMGPIFEPGTRIEVRFRSGLVERGCLPDGLRWTHIGNAGDIVKYRVEKPPFPAAEPAPAPAPEPAATGEEATGPNPLYHLDVPGYDALAGVLRQAFAQAASGKGRDRHAQGQPFEDQPMQQLIRLYGLGFALGQAGKKAQEAQRLPRDRAVHELLGAINYLAGAVIALEAGTITTSTKD